MAADLENHLVYLKSVLGVSGFLLPTDGAVIDVVVDEPMKAAPSLETIQSLEPQWQAHGDTNSFLVFFHSGEPLSAKLVELTDRMMKAMKHEPAQTLRLESPTLLTANDQAALRELLLKTRKRDIVCLGVSSTHTFLDLWMDSNAPSVREALHPGAKVDIRTLRVLSTHSLESLETSVALKKETWQHLQSLV